MCFNFLDDASDGNQNGVLEGISRNRVNGFIRRNNKVIMVCVVIINVSHT